MEKVAVKYVGPRATYTEGTYGSRIEFTQGQTVLIQPELAAKLLRHPDVYQRGEAEGAKAVEVLDDGKKKADEPDEAQLVRDRIATMDKDALKSFAKTTFRVDLDKRKGVNALRQQVTGLVDQYGVA